MAVRYTIDATNRQIRYTVEGAPDREALAQAARELLADPGFDLEFDFLCDYSLASSSSVSSADIVAMAQALRERLIAQYGAEKLRKLQRRFAIVAPRPVVFGLLRMFQSYYGAEDTSVRVFADVESAESWIREGQSGPA